MEWCLRLIGQPSYDDARRPVVVICNNVPAGHEGVEAVKMYGTMLKWPTGYMVQSPISANHSLVAARRQGGGSNASTMKSTNARNRGAIRLRCWKTIEIS